MKVFIFLFAAMLSFASCSSERTFYTYAAKNPNKVAELCAKTYQADTVYKQGATIVKTDTLTVEGDSIPCPDKPVGSIKTVCVKCPDAKTITRTVTRIDTIQVDKPSTLAQLQVSANRQRAAEDSQLKAEQSRDGWKSAFFYAIGALGVSIAAFILRNKLGFLKFLR